MQGSKGAVRLEQQQQGLRWQIYQQLKQAISGQEAGVYRSLLASLDLEVRAWLSTSPLLPK